MKLTLSLRFMHGRVGQLNRALACPALTAWQRVVRKFAAVWYPLTTPYGVHCSIIAADATVCAVRLFENYPQ